MVGENLSQTDIDLLLSRGVGAGTPTRGSTNVDAQLYDFSRPRRVSKERLRLLEGIYERFAKSLEAWLVGRVRHPVEIRLAGVEPYSFGEFTLSLPMPCATFGFDVRDGNGQRGALDVGYPLAFLLVDRLFGGAGSPVSMPRALTPIERLAIRTFVERALSTLTEVWQDYVRLPCEIASFEASPDLLQLGNREDPVLVATLEVTCEGVSSLLLVCLPFLSLDRFFASGDDGRVKERALSPDERRVNRTVIEDSLRHTSIDVAVRLPTAHVRMSDLLRAAQGRVLPTGIPTHAGLDVYVSGEPRFRGIPGRVRSQVAVRLLDPADIPDSISAGPV
ncbi:MAG: FliM/FliN family flagellar motor switch protein [Gemmatimonadetes bacterium]|nr:FliM/FliN family flagellar motor switch protein [Gemmatimonadota bacterium]